MTINTVSVVIPTIWRDSIFATIESVVIQSYPVKEIIVVSHRKFEVSERLLEVKNRFRNVIFLFSNSGGISENRNIGMKYASGDAIAFLDDDDTWYPKKIESQIEVMNNLNFDICFSNVDHSVVKFDFRERPKLVENQSILEASYGFWDIFRKRVFIPFPTVVIRRSAIGKVEFDEGLKEREDLWFLHQLQQSGLKVIQIPQKTALICKTRPYLNRPQSLEQEITWFNKLEGFQKDLGRKFLLNTAIRNRFATGHIRDSLKLTWFLVKSTSRKDF